jgi:hypothetical protein
MPQTSYHCATLDKHIDLKLLKRLCGDHAMSVGALKGVAVSGIYSDMRMHAIATLHNF